MLCHWVNCSQNVEEHSAVIFRSLDVEGYLKERHYIEGIDAHGKVILKYILKK